MPGSIARNRSRIRLAVLGPNLNRRTVVHERPDFFDLLISNCNAAVGPIARAMRRGDESVAVRQAMDEDVPTRRHAEFAGALLIGSIRIGNVQRAVKLAVGVPAIDNVHAFRRPMVSLPCLRPDRLPSERDLVGFEHLASVH